MIYPIQKRMNDMVNLSMAPGIQQSARAVQIRQGVTALEAEHLGGGDVGGSDHLFKYLLISISI